MRRTGRSLLVRLKVCFCRIRRVGVQSVSDVPQSLDQQVFLFNVAKRWLRDIDVRHRSSPLPTGPMRPDTGVAICRVDWLSTSRHYALLPCKAEELPALTFQLLRPTQIDSWNSHCQSQGSLRLVT